MNKFKEFIKLINDLKKTSKGRAILFFGGYFIFFLVLIIVVRISGTNNISSSDDYEKGTPFQFKVNNIVNNNYAFNYKVNLDGVVYNYVGEKYNNTEQFTLNDKSYYCEGDKCFINNSGLWVKCDSPYIYSYFFDILNIKNIFEKATYVSKTEYDSGKTSYNFLISSNTLNSMIDNMFTDIEEEPNEIVINTDEDNYVNEIKFKLDSYCINNNSCSKNLDIELYYDSYGQIEEFKSPLK